MCLLKKTKRTFFQARISRYQRWENVKETVVIRRKYKDVVKGKRILLVDDLCTTGATLKNASKPLLGGQPKSISAVVACRVI